MGSKSEQEKVKMGQLLCMFLILIYKYENRDMAIAMSSSRADPVLGLIIPSSCPGWGYLNI